MLHCQSCSADSADQVAPSPLIMALARSYVLLKQIALPYLTALGVSNIEI
jgi:hypothetical protein